MGRALCLLIECRFVTGCAGSGELNGALPSAQVHYSLPFGGRLHTGKKPNYCAAAQAEAILFQKKTSHNGLYEN
jgi:hypothetical protein